MSDEPPLEERIVEAIEEAPDDSASPATIRGLLATDQGDRPAMEDVQEAISELLDQDRIEVETTETDDPRYRLVDAGY